MWYQKLFMRRNFLIPAGFIKEGTDGIREAFMRSCFYASGTLLVFSPDFKKQRMFINAIFKKYRSLNAVNTVLATQHGIGLYDIIYRPFAVPLSSIVQDRTLKRCTDARDILTEAALLGGFTTLSLPPHPYSHKKPAFKKQYLELLIYWVCCTGMLTAAQLAVIEITALDFSISSFETTEYFKAAFSASVEARQQRIEALLSTAGFNMEKTKNDFAQLFDLRFTGKNDKNILQYKNKLDTTYFMNQNTGHSDISSDC